MSILDIIASSAKHLWSTFEKNADEAEISAYLICQLLALYAEGERRGIMPDPFSDFVEVTHEETKGLTLINKKARVFVGENCVLNKVVISGNNEAFLFFGKDAVVNGCEVACHAKKSIFSVGFSSKLEGLFAHLYANLGVIVLGPGVTTQPGCNFCVQENSYILVGSDSMFSNSVFVRTSDSHGIYDLDSRIRNNSARPVTLHSHTWISRACTLNKGTEVSPHTVIGQGSVVHGRLLSNSVYSGAPVQQVKRGITWDRKLAMSLEPEHDFKLNHFLGSFSTNTRRKFEYDSAKTCGFQRRLSSFLAQRPDDKDGKGFEAYAEFSEFMATYSTINSLGRRADDVLRLG